MNERQRSIPEFVSGWDKHSRDTTYETFFKYFMHQDVIITLEDGTEIITSAEKAQELQNRAHPIELPQSYGGER